MTHCTTAEEKDALEHVQLFVWRGYMQFSPHSPFFLVFYKF